MCDQIRGKITPARHLEIPQDIPTFARRSKCHLVLQPGVLNSHLSSLFFSRRVLFSSPTALIICKPSADAEFRRGIERRLRYISNKSRASDLTSYSWHAEFAHVAFTQSLSKTWRRMGKSGSEQSGVCKFQWSIESSQELSGVQWQWKFSDMGICKGKDRWGQWLSLLFDTEQWIL